MVGAMSPLSSWAAFALVAMVAILMAVGYLAMSAWLDRQEKGGD
jgi:hypothetical protein